MYQLFMMPKQLLLFTHHFQAKSGRTVNCLLKDIILNIDSVAYFFYKFDKHVHTGPEIILLCTLNYVSFELL